MGDSSERAWNKEPAAKGESLPQEIERLLARQTGLRLDGADGAKLAQLLWARAGRRFPSLVEWLASLPEEEQTRELEAFAARITPGETFFFRDHGQFDLLRCQLLPEILARRRRERVLRLWSAGCASGEEAYSLAMLVDMVLPERAGWQIAILGSDLGDEALAKARRGRYGKWSFRLVPPALQARYFRRDGEEWLLADGIRRMVSFHRGNLVGAALPDVLFRDMDLILCRNVLIYFSAEAVRAVAAKLAACLAEGGFLLTGHTELIGCPVLGLRNRLFPEGVVYQRTAGSSPGSHPALPPPGSSPFPSAEPSGLSPRPRPLSPPAGRGERSVPTVAPAGAGPGARAAAPARPCPRLPAATADIAQQASLPPPAVAAAQSLADRGDYAAAEAACREALAGDPLAPAPHFLLAQLAQLRGDYREAEAQLNRTLYLAPEHIAAALELAALYERSGRVQGALARRRAALDLLERLPAAAKIEFFEASAGELSRWLRDTGAP